MSSAETMFLIIVLLVLFVSGICLFFALLRSDATTTPRIKKFYISSRWWIMLFGFFIFLLEYSYTTQSPDEFDDVPMICGEVISFSWHYRRKSLVKGWGITVKDSDGNIHHEFLQGYLPDLPIKKGLYSCSRAFTSYSRLPRSNISLHWELDGNIIYDQQKRIAKYLDNSWKDTFNYFICVLIAWCLFCTYKLRSFGMIRSFGLNKWAGGIFVFFTAEAFLTHHTADFLIYVINYHIMPDSTADVVIYISLMIAYRIYHKRINKKIKKYICPDEKEKTA